MVCLTKWLRELYYLTQPFVDNLHLNIKCMQKSENGRLFVHQNIILNL